MKLAAAQFTPVPGEVAANARTAAGLVREAAGLGARITVFAELAVTGYDLALVRERPDAVLTEVDPRLGPVRDACRETGTAAVVNAPVALPGAPRPGLTSLVLGPDGELLARYDKTRLYGEELELFEAGTRDGRFTLDGVRFALAVCYDNRFPETAERARADGCAVYLASSVLEEGNDSFTTVYPVRAREYGLYVVLANTTGVNEIGDCRGRSAVYGPDGAVLASAGTGTPAVVVAEAAVGTAPAAGTG
jgi:5-aminopentanamidase